MKTALVCGVSGQDGAYLAKLLLEKGYHVIGTSRDAQTANFGNLERLSIIDDFERLSMVLTDFRSTDWPEFGRSLVSTAGRDHRKHRCWYSQSAGGRALYRLGNSGLQCKLKRMFR